MSQKLVAMLTAVVGLVVLAALTPAYAASVVTNTIADAHVITKDTGQYGDNNYGTSGNLEVAYYGNLEWWEKGYMRFDVSAMIETVGSASLSLVYIGNVRLGAGETIVHDVYGLIDGTAGETTWIESGVDSITWNNAPGGDGVTNTFVNATYLGTITLSGDNPVGTVYHLASASLVDFINADSNDEITIMMTGRNATGDNRRGYYAARENATYAAPALTLSTNEWTLPVNVDFEDVTTQTSSTNYVGLAAAPDNSANTFWNSVTGSGASTMLASDGTTITPIGVSISVGISGPTTFHPGNNDLTGDRAYVAGTTVGAFTISGLDTNSSYDIYLYDTHYVNNGHFAGAYAIGGVTQTVADIGSPPAVSNGTGWAEGDDYVLFTVDSDGSGEIAGSWTRAAANAGAALAGMQIVPTPTTSSALVNVDLVAGDSPTYSGLAAAPDEAGNTFWTTMLNASASNLNASDGSGTKIDLTVANYEMRNDRITGSYALNTDLTRDAFWVDNGPEADFTISDLDANTSYDIYFYTTYYTTANWGDTDYVIDGTTNTVSSTIPPAATDGTGWTEGDNYAMLTAISDGSGEISGTWNYHSHRFGCLSAMQIMPTPPPKGTVIVIK